MSNELKICFFLLILLLTILLLALIFSPSFFWSLWSSWSTWSWLKPTPINSINQPAQTDPGVIHASCRQNPCDDQLVCDSQSRRCKQPLNAPCAMDVDCQTPYRCCNWVCQAQCLEPNQSTMTEQNKVTDHNKHVHWREDHQIFHI